MAQQEIHVSLAPGPMFSSAVLSPECQTRGVLNEIIGQSHDEHCVNVYKDPYEVK